MRNARTELGFHKNTGFDTESRIQQAKNLSFDIKAIKTDLEVRVQYHEAKLGGVGDTSRSNNINEESTIFNLLVVYNL